MNPNQGQNLGGGVNTMTDRRGPREPPWPNPNSSDGLVKNLFLTSPGIEPRPLRLSAQRITPK